MDIKLNDKQNSFFNAIFDEKNRLRDTHFNHFAFYGAFRCGKSFITMLSVLLLCCNYPNTQAGIIRQTYPELVDSCIQQFLEAFPEQSTGYKYKIANRECIFNNGSRIAFRAFDRDNKIKSNSYDVALLVQAEEIPESLYLQVIGRMSGSNLPKPIIITEGNPRDCYLRELYIDSTPEFRERQGIFFISGETADNTENLPANYIENLKRNYPEDYLDRYLYGGWTKTSDRVYTALMDHHKIAPVKIQTEWYKCIGFDHGTVNDSSIVYIAKNSYGHMYVFDEWRKKMATLEDIYQACTKYGTMPIIADFSMKVGRPDQASYWDDLMNMGLNMIECKKDKTANILLVNKAFHQNKLDIFDHCEYTWGQHKRYQYKRASMSATENRKEEVVNRDDHSCDALQYAIRYLDTIKVESSDRFTPLARGRPSIKEIVTQGYDIG